MEENILKTLMSMNNSNKYREYWIKMNFYKYSQPYSMTYSTISFETCIQAAFLILDPYSWYSAARVRVP